MKNWKKYTSLFLALVMCLSLAACGGGSNEPDVEPDVGGTDWRTTGIWRSDGTITRNGEDTDVLVCIHAEEADFYYDTEEQVLFDSVSYPITLQSDAWKAFRSIDFADLNGDGNSDVTMNFNDDGNELLMVWFWDTESEQFVYQPEESQLGEADDGRGDLVPDDDGWGDLVQDDGGVVPALMVDELPFTNVEVLQYENYEDGTYYYADMAEDGLVILVNTVLPNNFVGDTQTVEDYLTACALDLGGTDDYSLQTVEENYAYSEQMSYPVYIVTYTVGGNEDAREWTVFAMGTDRYTYLYGFCASLDAADDVKYAYQDIFANLYLYCGEYWDDDYSWDSELCQRNVSEFEGAWYYDGDLSAMSYIMIDGYGNWSYYERTPGDPEGTRMDYGTFSYSAYEVSTYYADSDMYDGLSIRVFEVDEGVIIWNDDDTYYRME